jgi:hypothetical protein
MSLAGIQVLNQARDGAVLAMGVDTAPERD